MNPIVFAMRRPVMTLTLVVAFVSGGLLACHNMRVFFSPARITPEINVVFDDIGTSPQQFERFMSGPLKRNLRYMDVVQDVNTRNIQQSALCELFDFPRTDMGQAMAQAVLMSDRAMLWISQGVFPSVIIRVDTGSVPVGKFALESET